MIIKTRWAFSEDYVPPELINREPERIIFRSFLKPLMNGQHLLQSMFITGTIGVGKTVLTRFITKELPSNAIYIKLSEADNTTPKILIKLIALLGVPIPAYTPSNIALMNLTKWFNQMEKPTLLVLDDFEKASLKAIQPLLHDIPRETRWCNFLIVSRTPNSLENLPTDTKSTLRCRELSLPPYDKEIIRQIIEQRANLALYEDAIDPETIETIAIQSASYGNAREAIDILQYACQIAEESETKKITTYDVDLAIEMIEKRSLEDTIRNLPPYHRLILKNLTPSPQRYANVYYKWKHQLADTGLKALSIHRFRDFISDLKKVNLIELDVKGKGRGAGFQYSLFLAKDIYKIISQQGESSL